MLRVVVGPVAERRPEVVVQCGSGDSTVWLGYGLEWFGGRLVALEHDAQYATATRGLVDEHGLGGRVEVRHAPLEPWRRGELQWPWYARGALSGVADVGLVFVDGPPGVTAPLARYPAVPILLPYGTDDVVFVLDDADRPDERELSDRWLTEFPALRRRELPTAKGCHLLSRAAPHDDQGRGPPDGR